MTLDPLRWAKFFASVKHGSQTYGGLPYTHHLAAVAEVVRKHRTFCDTFIYRLPSETYACLLQACWLHDVIEDTPTKVKEIREMFGDTVADLVSAVTNEPGENRKIRAALTYPKIRAGGPLAVALKLADRIANVEQGGSLVGMYAKEYEDFKRNLYTPGQNEEMWKHLEGLLK